jgi:hypothetical protein
MSSGGSSLPQNVPDEYKAFAYYYLGIGLSWKNKTQAAAEMFRQCIDTGSNQIEVLLAKHRLGLFRLYQNPKHQYASDKDEFAYYATSCLASTPMRYTVDNLFDGKGDTAWAEGVDGPGIGEKLRMAWGEPLAVESLRITNGYAKSDAVFANNNRVKELKITLSNGKSWSVILADNGSPQTIPIDAKVHSIDLEIESVYPGTKYDDTCLSEVRVVFE